MNPVVTSWWLVRHAPVINPENRIYGQWDIPVDLGDSGAFEALARRLPEDAVWLVTQLERTRLTAEAIRPGGTYLVEPDLAEQSFGEWHGMSHAELDARDPQLLKAFWQAPATARPPGGESFADVVARVGPVLDRLSSEHAGRDIVAVCHGGSIRAALAVALAINPARVLAFQIDPVSLTRLDHIALPGEPAMWRIAGVNVEFNTLY